jgi:ABC-type bacteriocin/lantibiotic exporter with double-glycine peptidase domain
VLAPLSGLLYASAAYFITRRKSDTLFEEYVQENTVIIGTICAHVCDAKPYNDRVKLDIKKIERLAFRSNLKASFFESISGTCYLVAIVFLFLISAHLISESALTTGAIFASAIYLERVLSPTMSLISIYYSSREASYRRNRILSYKLQLGRR